MARQRRARANPHIPPSTWRDLVCRLARLQLKAMPASQFMPLTFIAGWRRTMWKRRERKSDLVLPGRRWRAVTIPAATVLAFPITLPSHLRHTMVLPVYSEPILALWRTFSDSLPRGKRRDGDKTSLGYLQHTPTVVGRRGDGGRSLPMDCLLLTTLTIPRFKSGWQITHTTKEHYYRCILEDGRTMLNVSVMPDCLFFYHVSFCQPQAFWQAVAPQPIRDRAVYYGFKHSQWTL